jgi:hypothetical protein
MFEIRHHNPILTIVLHGWQSTRLDPTAECPLVSSCPGSCFLKRQGAVRIGHVRAHGVRALVVIAHARDDSRSMPGDIAHKAMQRSGNRPESGMLMGYGVWGAQRIEGATRHALDSLSLPIVVHTTTPRPGVCRLGRCREIVDFPTVHDAGSPRRHSLLAGGLPCRGRIRARSKG